MLPKFDSPWILDRDTGTVADVSGLYQWSDVRTGPSGWGAAVPGFSVTDPEQDTFDAPDEIGCVAVAPNILKQMYTENRVVDVTDPTDGDTFTVEP